MDILWQDLIAAVALVLILEGLLPFVSPTHAKLAYSRMSALNESVMRSLGLVTIGIGVVSLVLARS